MHAAQQRSWSSDQESGYCNGNGTEMLVLVIQAPPIQGIAAQPTPTAFCFKGPIDLNKLLPQ